MEINNFADVSNNNCTFIDDDNVESTKRQIFSSLIFILKIFLVFIMLRNAGNKVALSFLNELL